MDIFTFGLIILTCVAIVFYIVLFSFIFYWHLKKISFVIIPTIFTFEFFVIGFFIVSIVSIIINYLPVLVNTFNL